MSNSLKWYSFRWQVALLIIIIGGGFYYWWQSDNLPSGKGSAGPSIDESSFSQTWSDDNVVLIGLGDSMTWGFGASLGHSYFDLLLINDDNKHPDMNNRDLLTVFPRIKKFNYAENYTTSEQHLKSQVPKINQYDTRTKGIVVMTSGGNDLIHDYGIGTPKDGALYGATYEQAMPWAKNYELRLISMIEEISTKFPGGAQIFIANIYDPTDGLGDIENANIPLPPWPDGLKIHNLFNQTIANVANQYEHVHLVDIYSEFLGHGIHCRDKNTPHYRQDDPYYWYYLNFEDPNDRGYDAIRRLFLQKMIEVYSS